MKPSGPLFHWFAVVTVSAYMIVCASWLMARGKIDPRLIWRTLRASTRRKWRGPITGLQHENGHCYTGAVDSRVPSDADIGSRLVVLENGVPLAEGHCGHDDVRRLGAGRYSHWCANVYFSASDNSDPRSNGRTYTAEER